MLNKNIFSFFLCYVINIRNDKYIKSFGRNLIKLRNATNLSQEKLAHKADIPVNQVGRIERGEINTSLSTIYVIANALEIDPYILLKFEID